MKKTILALVLLMTLYSCKNATREEKPVLEKTEASLLKTGCYTYKKNGDTIVMHITQAGSFVTGELDIAYAEKDASTGTFKGKLKGDTLLATYTFYSEGLKSNREVAFLVKKDQLIEGFGSMDKEGTRFENPLNLNYPSQMPLSKVACTEE